MYLFGTAQSADPVVAAIQGASRSTGTDFAYLLATAKRESSLNPDAKAPTSSAAGLFQFIEQTWLRTVRDSGGRHGLGDIAGKIETTSDGRAFVRDGATRQDILALRYDAETAAVMAGEFTRANADELRGALGRAPKPGELYIAHFLGSDGAKRLISLAESRPSDSASTHFPGPAKSNRPIFFGRDGSPRSVQAVYDNLIAKHQAVEAEAVAASGGAGETRGLFADFAAAIFGRDRVAAPLVQTASSPSAFADGSGQPMFHSMYAPTNPALGPIGGQATAMWADLFSAPTRPQAPDAPTEARAVTASPDVVQRPSRPMARPMVPVSADIHMMVGYESRR